MSGFFGIFSPTGSIDLESFEQMRNASEGEGFDGMETLVEDNVAMGHLMLRVSPESAYDKQPLISTCGNYILVGHFRLDYRDELGDKLGLVQSDLEKTPDSIMVMMAYQKWKEKCVRHLEGDYAFALYDRQHEKVSLFRDAQGYCAMFYFLDRGTLYFSSDITSLLAIDKFEYQLNELQLYSLLMNYGSVRSGQTVINNICLLNSATNLNFDRTGVSSIRPFNLTELVPIDNWKFEEDVINQLHIVFALAVKSRARADHPLGVFLSSGFDSSSVAYYLAKESQGIKKKIFSFTSYPHFLNELPSEVNQRTNEEPLVRKFLGSISNIDSQFLDFPKSNTLSLSPLELIKDPVSPISSINSFWINGIFSHAKEKTIRRMFCGQVGNFSISWDGSHLPSHLISKFKITSAIRCLLEIAKTKNNNFISTLYSYLVLDLIRLINFKLRRRLNYFSAKKFFAEFAYDLKRSEWADQQKDLFNKPGFYFNLDPEKLRLNFLKHTPDTASLKWHVLAHSQGIEIVDPTADIRILNFFKSLNGRYYFKNGISRYIYRKWMSGNLPSEILEKKYRIMQSADIGYRMVQDVDFYGEVDYSAQSLPAELKVLHSKLRQFSRGLKDTDDFSEKRKYAASFLRFASVYSILDYFKFQSKSNIFDP